MEEKNFDFMSQVMGDFEDAKLDNESVELEQISDDEIQEITNDDLVFTSYLLVNTLINLLVDKNIIKMGEVSSLLKDLHNEFKKRGR